MVAVRKDYAAPTGLEFCLGCGSTKMPRLRRYGRSRTTKPRPARQSGSLSGNAQTPRRRLAMTHRHGRNINANPTRGFSRGRWTIPIFGKAR